MSRTTDSLQQHQEDQAATLLQPAQLHRVGRQLSIVALVVSVAYLVWRSVWSLHSKSGVVAWWLALPTLVLEISGVATVALLVWALWRSGTDDSIAPTSARPTKLDYDVVVVATARTAQDLRATLVSLQLDASPPNTVVVDLGARTDIVQIALEFGATFHDSAPTDPSGLAAALSSSERDFFLLLNAGDVPAADAVSTLMHWVTDSSIGVVQGVVGSAPGVASEDAPNARHELTFERTALNPGLGRRGTGIVTGSGALVRRSALAGLELGNGSRQQTLFELMPRLAANSIRVVSASGVAVVVETPLIDSSAVAANRAAMAAAGWQLLVGKNGAVRARHIRLRDRLALAAWSMRSADRVRRVLLAAIVFGALLSGQAPFNPTLPAIVYLWLPMFLTSSASLTLLSNGAMRPGDRVRNSVRSMKVSMALVIAINAVLLIRGISDRFTHALRPMDKDIQIGLTAVALWLLGAALDSMRLLAWRRHSRRALRLQASGTARLDEYGVYVSDITMFGAGLLADQSVRIREGGTHRLTFTVPSESGVTSLDIPCVIRNVRADLAGAWRIGVEFYDADQWALNALAESCAVIPARASMAGSYVGVRQVNLPISAGASPGRIALRAATLFALLAVVLSIAPIDVEATGPTTRRVVGTVVDDGTSAQAVSNIPVVAVCSTNAGPDGTFGTADDAYGTVLNTTTDALGQYGLDVAGAACWLSVEPPLPSNQPTIVAQMPVEELTETPAVINLGGTGTITMAPATLANHSDTDTNIANTPNATHPAPRAPSATPTTAASYLKNLPSPSSQQVENAPQTTGSKLSVLMVMLMVALLAGSVMLSSAPASRVRLPISQ